MGRRCPSHGRRTTEGTATGTRHLPVRTGPFKQSVFKGVLRASGRLQNEKPPRAATRKLLIARRGAFFRDVHENLAVCSLSSLSNLSPQLLINLYVYWI